MSFVFGKATDEVFAGFTENEVQCLCADGQVDFEDMRTWYDGYSFSRIGHVYSPNSVMNALQEGEILNYWTQTETFESLKGYIGMDYDGALKDYFGNLLLVGINYGKDAKSESMKRHSCLIEKAGE